MTAAAAAMGIVPDHSRREREQEPTCPFVLWPENLLPMQIIQRMQTQWHEGMNGRTGLRYDLLPQELRALKVPRAQREYVIAAVRVLELELLRLWREKR